VTKLTSRDEVNLFWSYLTWI